MNRKGNIGGGNPKKKRNKEKLDGAELVGSAREIEKSLGAIIAAVILLVVLLVSLMAFLLAFRS